MAFTYYSPLTIDHTKVPNTDQTDFPVLVSLTDARLKTVGNGGHVQNASGFDIRPYTDSALTTAITGYELESYNASTGALLMWVKISSLSHSTDTVFYLAYGDSGLSSDGSSTGTWDSSYQVVYHFGNGSLSLKDSTANANNLTNNGGATSTTGQIGGAVALDGLSQWLNSGSNVPLSNTDHVTLQAWINSTAIDGNFREILRNSTGNHFLIQTSGNTWGFTVGGSTYADAGNPAAVSGNHFLVGTFDGTNNKFYLDGTLVNTYADAAANDSAHVMDIGTVDGSQLFGGWIDEARVSTTNRSADWIATEYHNQNSPSTFETLGTEVPVGGGGISIPALNPNMRGGFQSFMRGGFVN
jgi:hypothetical protein